MSFIVHDHAEHDPPDSEFRERLPGHHCPDGARTCMRDLYDLQRFVDAQNLVFDQVLRELRDGRKQSHWMWFVFPQIHGLGHSPMAEKYAISSRAEAEAYLGHPILGPRLRQCSLLVTQVEGRSIEKILGYPDNMKFRSSMTLFAHATTDNQVFTDALRKYFAGTFDPLTLERIP
jgi:uncharacterized protein (DUF1810 family)